MTVAVPVDPPFPIVLHKPRPDGREFAMSNVCFYKNTYPNYVPCRMNGFGSAECRTQFHWSYPDCAALARTSTTRQRQC